MLAKQIEACILTNLCIKRHSNILILNGVAINGKTL